MNRNGISTAPKTSKRSRNKCARTVLRTFPKPMKHLLFPLGRSQRRENDIRDDKIDLGLFRAIGELTHAQRIAGHAQLHLLTAHLANDLRESRLLEIIPP